MSSPTTPANAKRQRMALPDDTPRPARHNTVAQYAAVLDTPSATVAPALRSTSTAESASTSTSTAESTSASISTAESASASTSTAASVKQKRTRSPVKAVADLRMADAGIEYRDLEKRTDELSAQGRGLYDDILAFANGEAIIPTEISDEFAHAAGRHRLRPHNLRSGPDAVPKDTLVAELRQAERVRNAALVCIEEHDSEPTWNTEVHSRILSLALRPHPAVGYKDVTTAEIGPSYLVPALPSGDLVASKMVDYALYLSPEHVGVKRSVHSLLQRQPPDLQSVNQTRYDSLRHRPIAVSIETRTPDAPEEEARVQLVVWAAAQLRRLRLLNAASEPLVLPLVYISGPSWYLMFASMDPDDGSLRLYGKLDMGETRSLTGVYKLLASLRRLAAWVEQDFKDWFVASILYGMTDAVEPG